MGLKTRSLSQIKEILCGSSRGKMSCSIHLKIGRNVCPDKISDEYVGHFGTKNNSLGQIKDVPCGRSRGNLSFSIDLKIGPNICLGETLDMFEFVSPGVINQVTSQIEKKKKKPCGRWRGHIFCLIDLEIAQNVCLDEISNEFEFQSPGVIK